jgi:3-dehydroquinate synthase
MVIVARAALKAGRSEEDCLTPILNILNKFGFPLECPYSASELTKAALKDKKRTGDTITLVIPVSLGNCQLVQLPIDKLESFIEGGL